MDKLDSNLAFDASSVKVTLGNTTLTSGTDYNVNAALDDGCTFEVTMDLAKLYEAKVIDDGDIEEATSIVVTYDATLSGKAVSGSFPNEAWVTYEGPGESAHDTVNVLTYAIRIFKYDQSTSDEAPLSGAVFTLYGSDGTTVIATETSGNNGYAIFGGLAEGSYTLKETTAPEGYVASTETLQVNIPTDADTEQVVNAKFANSPIPHTGGMGTAMFTVGGAAILAAAGALFVTTRRKRDF